MPDTIDGEKETTRESSYSPCTIDELAESLQNACARMNWTSLMPVQSQTLPYLQAGCDIMVQSRTGSGKTGAYLLPLLTLLDSNLKKAQVLILVPTRELALQVVHEAEKLFAESGISPVAVYGGVSYRRQNDMLRSGAQIIIGTPGRILDHLIRGSLTLSSLRSLIFDEADRMLSIGFYPDMKKIQTFLPGHHILSALFSATYPEYVLNLADEFLHNAKFISLSQGEVHVAAIQHLFVQCGRMEKERTLVKLLEIENPSTSIIFCNTKSTVHYITAFLQGYGYDAEELSSDLSQNKREKVLTRLRENRLRFLVATDVAARGIDIPSLSHVFLYDPPEDREDYIHRSGRTGRAGSAGTVISIVDIMEKLELSRIASFYRINLIQIPIPTEEEVINATSARVLAHLDTLRRNYTGLQLERASRYLPFIKSLQDSDDQDQLLLLAILVDSDYRGTLLNPLYLPEKKTISVPRSFSKKKKNSYNKKQTNGNVEQKREETQVDDVHSEDVVSGAEKQDNFPHVNTMENTLVDPQKIDAKSRKHRRRSRFDHARKDNEQERMKDALSENPNLQENK